MDKHRHAFLDRIGHQRRFLLFRPRFGELGDLVSEVVDLVDRSSSLFPVGLPAQGGEKRLDFLLTAKKELLGIPQPAGQRFFLGFLECTKLALVQPAHLVRLAADGTRFVAFVRKSAPFLLKLGDDVFGPDLPAGQERPGMFDQLRRKRQTRRDQERIALSGKPLDNAECRHQGRCVELHRCGLHLRMTDGEVLERCQMGGHDDLCVAFEEPVKDGQSKGGTLLGVGSRSEFIQKDQRIFVSFVENGDDVLHVG